MRDEKQGGKQLPVVLPLSPPLLLGAVDWNIMSCRPNMGSTAIGVQVSNTDMAAVMRRSLCDVGATPCGDPANHTPF